MNRLVIATGNTGKLGEIRTLLEPLGMEVLPQSDYCVTPVEETGLTFVENALLKARHASAVSGLPALADDSGLVVDALQGEPGIRSARYAGQDADDRANVHKLLAALDGVEEHRRTARFHCVLALLRHPADPTPILCEGSWEGRIAGVPRGSGGFGYDPVFHVPSVRQTAAQLQPSVKNHLSHRGQALQALVARLRAET